MRVLIVTTMYPTMRNPGFGIFIKEQVDSLREAGIDVKVQAFLTKGRKGANGYLRVVRNLQRTVREHNYDIVHAHYGLTGAVARMQWQRPLIVTFHGSDLIGVVNNQYQYTTKGWLTTVISRAVALAATHNIVVSHKLQAKLWLKRNSSIIPMGVDLDMFKPLLAEQAREQLGLTSDRKRVLFLWPPHLPIKRFDVAQQAVVHLQHRGMNVELLPVHTASHDQIPLYMNACDALVLTSMHEASPCVIKEALACNLPIVSVDVGDVAERIRKVDGCYLCERQPQDVADKLQRVLQSERRIQGRDTIRHLSLANIAHRVIEVYEAVLQQ